MKSSVVKLLRITGIVLVVFTLMSVIGFAAVWFIFRPHHPESTAIIGGADSPTSILLISKYGWIYLLTGGILVAGIGSIIASSVINKKFKKK